MCADISILQPVSHTTIPKPMPPSTAVFMISKAVRLWKAQSTFGQSLADEDRAVSLTASLRLN